MLLRAIILAAVVLAGGLSQQTPPRDAPAQLPRGTGVIAGTLTLGDGNQPARKARITLSGITRPGRTATSDDNGRFMFAELPAGSYTLQASKPGYLSTYYGAKRPWGAGTPVTLAEGQRVSLPPLALIKGGVITGTVSDPSGQSAPRASVTILRFGQDSLTGEQTLGTFYTDTDGGTDDRGVYRAFGLPPGDYLVSVTPSALLPATAMRQLTSAEIQRALLPPTGGSTPVAPAPIQLVNYAPVFHPSATDLSTAVVIKLGPSEERTGVDVRMQLVPVATISGALPLPTGVRATNLQITLERRGPQAALFAGAIRALSARIAPDGTFTISNVTPGAYTVKVQPFGATTGAELWGMTDVDVDGRDLTVAVSLQPTMTVTAVASFEGVSDGPNTGGLQFFIKGRNSGGLVTGSTRDAQGRMTVRGVLPGEYRLSYSTPNTFGNWWLRSMLWNGIDLLDEPLEVRPGENPDLKAVFTDRPTELSGVLQDASGRAATDYYIVVFTTDRAVWRPASRRIRMIRPAIDGRFVVSRLPPADYFVAALTDVEPNSWFDPEFLAQLVPSAIKVSIAEGQQLRQDLRIGR